MPRSRNAIVDDVGLRIEIEPLQEWPPATRAAERREIGRLLSGEYEKRRSAIEARRHGYRAALQSHERKRRRRRTQLLLAAAACFLLGMLLLAGRDTLGGIPMLLSIVVLIVAFAGRRKRLTLHDEEHPPLGELEALHDRILNEELRALWDDAVRRLAVARVGEPERTLGPYLSYPDIDRLRDVWVGARLGADGVPRFTPRSIYYLSFHAERVIAYEGVLDVLRGVPLVQCVREFAYGDITAVTRLAERRVFHRRVDEEPGKGAPFPPPANILPEPGARAAASADKSERIAANRDLLRLELANGEHVQLVLHDDYLAGATTPLDLPQNASEATVEWVRALVREKSSQRVPAAAGPRATPAPAEAVEPAATAADAAAPAPPAEAPDMQADTAAA
ncbi:MAG: hypothetical protein AB7E70_01245 [Hyphomicrobiaceae bacterium]